MASVLLVHGWGGSYATTWQRSGFAALLEDGGKHVIGVDLLGHGTADKPHDPAAYADLTERIVDRLPDEPVEAVGFSLGALTLLRTAVAHPDRFSKLVLAGIGRNVLERDDAGTRRIVAALDRAIAGDAVGVGATDGGGSGDGSGADESVEQVPRLFVQYARQPGNDIEALAAVLKRPPGDELDAAALATVACPVLVVVGDQDFVHPGDELAARFPDGRCTTLRNVDHFATPEAFGFFDAALEFLDAI